MDATLLANLPDQAFAFALLLARIGCACMMLPGIGEAELPAMLRAGFAVAISALLLPAISPLVPAIPANGVAAGFMVVAEVVTGLWFGWLTRLLILALPIAGQVIGSLAGWSNVLQPDAVMGGQASAISRALALAAPVALLASGLHALPLAALAGSYRLIPPGALLPAADSLQQVVAAMGVAFALVLRLAAPFVLGGMIWQAALALLSRLVPQLQVYFVAMPGQILGGVLLLAVLGSAMLTLWLQGARAGFLSLPGA